MPENEVLFSKLDSKIKRGLDYYGVLGLTKGATIDEIKDAYKKLSVQYNPLRHPDCSDEKMETLFCLIGEAYEALSEPLRRALYDQFGEECLKKGIMTPIGWFPPWQYHGSPLQTFKNFHGSGNPFADVINCMREMVCMMKSSGDIVKEKQPSIEMDLELTLEEVYFGAWKKVKIRRRAFNEDQITTHEEEKVICVQIKPGTPEGTQFIYKNVGDEGLQVEPGDLIITTKDIPHPRFKRGGVNLLMDIRLDLHRSLGHLTIELFTIDCRTIRFAITELIDPGYTKVVPDEGMPYYEDNLVKGDLYLKFDINFPQQLTEKARRKMIEALMDTGSDEEEDMPDDLEERLRAAERAREAALQGEGGEGGPPKLVCTDYQDINKIKGLYKL